jgi:hypothetical protein
MLIEMRRYAVLPGHMANMHARMSGLLFRLFREQGVPLPIAIWENNQSNPTLTWLVAWSDFEQRQQGWARVAPLFAAARSREGTPEFVTRTTLTLIAPWPQSQFGIQAAPAACETAWHVQPRVGFGAGFMAACQGGLFDRFRALGASQVNGCNFLFGALPQAMVVLGWPDAATRAAAMATLAHEPLGLELEDGLIGEGPCLYDRGLWETLDRASYLDHSAVSIDSITLEAGST